MKIAIFTDDYLPQVDGISVHVDEICHCLTQAGHTVKLFVPSSRAAKALQKGKSFKISYIPSIPIGKYPNTRFAFPFSPEITQEIKDFDPDVIHFHTCFMVGFQGIFLAKLLNIPLVGTFHTYFMEPEYLQTIGLEKVKLDKNKFITQMGWNYATFFYNKADMVISPSHFTKKDLVKKGLKVPVKVISNGIDYEKLKDMQVEKSFALPSDYFLYVGRLSIEKNLETLVEAYAQFASKNNQIDLVLAGDGPMKKELEKLIKELHIKKRVHFVGMIPHDKLIQSNIFVNATGFVTASKVEIQPLSLLEAMSFGLPIIGVESRGVSELIKENGILCKSDTKKDLSEAMHKLTKDKAFYKKCVQASLRMAEKNSIHMTAKDLEKVYLTLQEKL